MAVSDFTDHALLPEDNFEADDLQFTFKYNCDDSSAIRPAYSEGTHDIRFVVNSEVVYEQSGGGGLWVDGTGSGTIEYGDTPYTPSTPQGSKSVHYTLSAQDVIDTSIQFGYSFTISVELKRYQDSTWTEVISDSFIVTKTGGSPPSKASNPTPANASGPGIDFDSAVLTWSGDGSTYDVYGGGGGNFSLIAGDISEATYTLQEIDKVLFRCFGSATPVQWRVDSTNEYGTTTGDVWTFDPRPAKVTTPAPIDTATGQSIYQGVGWAASEYASTYDVWFSAVKAYSETVSISVLLPATMLPLAYATEFTWRVDPVNYYGTTEGDDWTFTTLDWDPPHVSLRSLETGGVVAGPFDPETMYATGENFLSGMRRLIVFCGTSLWFESIDSADP